MSSSDLDPRLAGLLAYLIPPITGIVFLLAEKKNEVVRWHAAQSTVFGIAWIVAWVVITVFGTVLSAAVPILGAIVAAFIWLVLVVGAFILWLVCLIKGYSGEKWRMPMLAQFADRVVGTSETTA
jgi:uncharacterized membrane protein